MSRSSSVEKTAPKVYMTQKSAAVVAGSKQPQPCAKKNQRVSIFNPFTNRMARVSPYSAKAKKIYKYYIEELDYDPAWVAPRDLKFYEDSGRFRRVKSNGDEDKYWPPGTTP